MRSARFVGLAENDDDVFDEVVNCGEDLWAALDGHSHYDNEGEYKPRNETNDRGITDELTRIGRGELNQTLDPDFHARRVVTAEKRRHRGRNLLPLPARNHACDPYQRRREVQSNK